MADKGILKGGQIHLSTELGLGSEVHAESVKAGGYAARVASTLTRPGDTITYSAGDQVANSTSAPLALTFSGCARYPGGSGIILGANCFDSFNQATKPNQRLYLFAGTAAPTANNDNAAFNPSDADFANAFAVIEFSSWEQGGTAVGSGGNCKSFVSNINKAFVCPAGAADLYGLVVERGSYSPGSAEYFTYTLGIVQD